MLAGCVELLSAYVSLIQAQSDPAANRAYLPQKERARGERQSHRERERERSVSGCAVTGRERERDPEPERERGVSGCAVTG